MQLAQKRLSPLKLSAETRALMVRSAQGNRVFGSWPFSLLSREPDETTFG
jgi:hypothetical protein